MTNGIGAYVEVLAAWRNPLCFFRMQIESSPERDLVVIPLLPDSQPLFQRMYRLAPSVWQEVQRQVTDLLAKKLIEPSTSPLEHLSCLWRRRLEISGWW